MMYCKRPRLRCTRTGKHHGRSNETFDVPGEGGKGVEGLIIGGCDKVCQAFFS